MKLLLLISAVVLADAVVVAVPVQTDDDVDNLVDTVVEKPQVYKEKPTVDVTDLINDMRQLHQSASGVINQVEVTLSTLKSLMPHSIRKRQTTLEGSVFGSPGNPTGRVDVKHRFGDKTWDGNINYEPVGKNYGAGISFLKNNTKWGVDVNKGPTGIKYDANYKHNWNDGRTNIKANIGHGKDVGVFGGFTFTQKF